MSSTECILQKILKELEKLNNRIEIRTNTVTIIEIDTADTSKRSYNMQKIFQTPHNVIAVQLTVLDKGGGFFINVNNSGVTNASIDYEIDNEEIKDIEVYGSGAVGTGKIRLGANL